MEVDDYWKNRNIVVNKCIISKDLIYLVIMLKKRKALIAQLVEQLICNQ